MLLFRNWLFASWSAHHSIGKGVSIHWLGCMQKHFWNSVNCLFAFNCPWCSDLSPLSEWMKRYAPWMRSIVPRRSAARVQSLTVPCRSTCLHPAHNCLLLERLTHSSVTVCLGFLRPLKSSVSLSLLPSARAAQSSRAGTGRASFREQQAVALHRSPFHNESGGFPWHAYYCSQCSGTSLALKGKVHRSHSQRFSSLTCRLCFPFPFTDSNDDRLSCQIFVRCPTVRLPVDRWCLCSGKCLPTILYCRLVDRWLNCFQYCSTEMIKWQNVHSSLLSWIRFTCGWICQKRADWYQFSTWEQLFLPVISNCNQSATSSRALASGSQLNSENLVVDLNSQFQTIVGMHGDPNWCDSNSAAAAAASAARTTVSSCSFLQGALCLSPVP